MSPISWQTPRGSTLTGHAYAAPIGLAGAVALIWGWGR